MKRFLPLIVIALLIAGFVVKSRVWPSAESEGLYLGYVEGETILLSAPVSGRLVSRAVERGDHVTAGAAMFQIDPAVAEADVRRATAAVADAQAQLDNIKTGKRAVELDVIRAQRQEAEAALRYAEQDLTRANDLVAKGTATRARADQAASQAGQLRARVAQMKAQEAAGDLGGRAKELEAAEARVIEARAGLQSAQSRLADLHPCAPADALVENTFFDAGEWVAAGQPVVSLLPANKVKLRFFVPQDQVARATPGRDVSFRCDGCSGSLTAKITYVSPRAEFTPPVIYSESARQKLVFLVEARPLVPNKQLRPGLAIEVARLTGDGP